MASPLAAASAYANIARLVTDPTHALANAAGRRRRQGRHRLCRHAQARDRRVTEAGRKSDAQTQAMVNGKSNMVDVVTAVAETEVAVDAVVAVRDKVIAAYEEIMKMPI